VGAQLAIASPEGYGLGADELAGLEGVRQVVDPAEAVGGAQIVYTDVWVSMGQDAEAAERTRALAAYHVNGDLLAKSDDAWFLHCLPARRGEEVTDAVMEGTRSAVWRQAENRMHSARGAMAWMLGTLR
jgi:ornithine carbamoyltransferase